MITVGIAYNEIMRRIHTGDIMRIRDAAYKYKGKYIVDIVKSSTGYTITVEGGNTYQSVHKDEYVQ